MSATLTAIIALIEAAVQETPTIIADIEKLLGAAKSKAPLPPIEPGIASAMASADAALNTPVK